ncbi:hypothetical protein Poli38472_007090 [Pythium oligandrum]|uniref:Uncharacterized protein n=1 Tax=Pythium oligandrum TaxID=41045 RepID=A0A8K1C9G2_PYTOL|nr:hypothetical protein Poli38472_007090 [Pythium oligandrum]|eukprot:TMW58945.1 hypothetical protein Poli38472_007090 [Pythium oligandrum]
MKVLSVSNPYVKTLVFKWLRYLHLHEDTLQFALKKRFASISATDLLERTWRLVSCEKQWSKLFHPAFGARIQRLQLLDTSSLVFYRTIVDASLNCITKTVYVLAKRHIPGGYSILFRSIDPVLLGVNTDAISSLIEDLTDESLSMTSKWVTKHAWTVFLEDTPEPC